MAAEDEAWAQTLITVTPEDDATIREISDSTTLSSTPGTDLNLGPDNIVHRRTFTDRQFVDPLEAEEAVEATEEVREVEKQNAENQTYLEGIPSVYISVEYKDEGSQTMYMSSPCPPLKYFRDIMTSMSGGPMPTFKRSNVTETIMSFVPDEQEDIVMEQLSKDVIDVENAFFTPLPNDEEETEMEVTEALNFLIARVFWINDPASLAKGPMADQQTQTYIIYNNRGKTFIIDRQTQTDLTCEPKESHTKLLSDYWEAKNAIVNYLESCISKAIDARIIIDDIIDEIVDKCGERVRYPMKEQVAQTIATYKLHEEKEEDVLRKLRIDMIVDPFEASIVVVPLMSELLHLTCDVVSQDAVNVSKIVLNGLLQRISTIIGKLMELQKEFQRKPIDQILAKRKEKILELMTKKETETIGTQTSIAAIAEVKKIKKSQEILCSVCRRQSMCQWCLDNGEVPTASQQEMKVLRTQDILLAYKPCYVVTKATEKDKYLLQPPCAEKKAKPPVVSKRQLTIDSSEGSQDTIPILLQSGKDVEPRESFNEWSYVTDATLMKPYSLKESVCSTSQTTMTLLDQTIFQNTSSRCGDALTSQAANALQILKNTFCNRENCATPSSLHILKTNHSFTENDEAYTRSTCACLSKADNKICGQGSVQTRQSKPLSKLHLCKVNTYSHSTSRRKSNVDGFKIIPICVSQNSHLETTKIN